MKRQILLGLFLLTVFCAAPVFAQEKSAKKVNLVTEFVKLKNLQIPSNAIQYPLYAGDDILLTKEQNTFINIFTSLFSKRGSIGIGVRNNTLILTDTANRIKFIKGFIDILDNSGFTFEEFVNENAGNEKVISEIVKTDHLFPIVTCELGKDEPWMVLQGILLFRPMKKINVRIKSFMQKDEAEIIGTAKRIELAKKVITLFDQPFLTEEEDQDF